MYFRSASLGKKVERFIKSSSDYSQAEKSDILFYVMYCVICLRLHSAEIDIQRFKEINLDDISDEEIGHAAQIVSTIYNELGGNNKVAKSSSLLERVQEVVVQ